MRNPVRRLLGSLCGACILIALACNSAPEPNATIRTVSGTASVSVRSTGTSVPAAVGTGLFTGDIVQTGEDGRMKVEFANGDVIELDGNTTVEIRETGASQTTIGAIVVSGTARAQAKNNDVALQIGLPFENKVLEIGTGPVTIKVSDDQLAVLVGDAVVVSDDGSRETVDEGRALTVAGVVIELSETPEVEAVQPEETVEQRELEPIVITLFANPSQVQVKRKDRNDWSRPKKQDRLEAGDAVRTRKRGGAILASESGSRLRLDANTEVRVETAEDGDPSGGARYALASGRANLKLKPDVGTGKTSIRVGGAEVILASGLTEGDVAVSTGPDGKSRVAVQHGTATLPDGTVVGAGQSIAIKEGKLDGEPTELAATDVQLRSGMSSMVYFTSSIPSVVFSWKKEEGKRYQIELSKSKDFSNPVFKEALDRSRFVYDKLSQGRYYWRVKGGGEWSRGTFRVNQGQPSSCGKNCGRENRIRDTGEKTVIYFQQALPSITLTWKDEPEAESYRLKVFRDGEFEKALVDQTVKVTSRKFAAGQFTEGRYFWLVNALAVDGTELRTGGTNGLEIAFDNTNVDIQISSPSSNQRVKAPKVVTAGEVPLGQNLFINGQKAALDRKGRFRQFVRLNYKGRHSIVYRTMASDGVERYYVRDVYRL